ncbi:MAG: carboxypeptidase regulatory-like domain-containing protein [Acidobacteriia bacterium]|nr:carboxypeptidase regulatory-like domain-containing protein [Terriglobia bacterium]
MTNGVRILRSLGFLFALISVVAFGAILALGQAIDGNVVGTITDASGAAVVGADVTVTNVATNVSATTKTNGSGEYRFEHLLNGTYRVSVKMTGFKTISEQVDIEVSKTATRNISLQPGAASETIEVSGTPPTLDTTTAQIQSTYELRETQDLPTSSTGLGVLNLSLLQAGVGTSGGLGAGTGPSVGGQRPRNNNFMIEAVDNNDKGVTGPLLYVPNDAVQNFSVLQNQFSPEFGHSNGAQFNTIVASGTNTIHGRVYEYFQNRNLNALDTSLTNQGITTVPRYDNNRFGGQIGGPIIKNKLFYFANFEYNPIGLSPASGSVVCAPTAAGYTTLLGIAGVSTSNVQGLQQYAQAPSANSSACTAVSVSGTPIEVGVLPLIAPNYNNTRALTTSMDYNLSDKDQIRGRYIYNKLVTLDTSAQLGIFFTPFLQPYHLISLSEYHTFSGALGNEFRVGFTRTAQDFTVPGGNLAKFQNLDAFPNLTVENLGNLNVGPDPNAPQYAIQNNYQAIDNVSWVKGNHTLKFGFEGRKNISPQKFIQRSRGDYDWKTLQGFALDQTPDHIAERAFGSAGYSGDQYGLFAYVNDIWKVRPNLSLNLGLRYEYMSTPYGWTQQSLNSVADVPGLVTFASPQAPTKDFMPRIGFAYSPGTSGNTSIRGGFGIGYDVLYDNIGTLSRPPQIGFTEDCPSGPHCPPSGSFLASGGIPPQTVSGISVLTPDDARASTSAFLPAHVKYPYSESWNLGIQHVFRSNYTVDVRYVGTRGVHLNVQNRLNFVTGVTPATGVPTYIQAPDQATVNGLTNAWATCDPTSLATTPGGVQYCNGLNLADLDTGCGACGDAPGTLSEGYNDFGTPPGGGYDPAWFNNGFFGAVVGFMPWGASTYHGLQTQVNRRFSNGLQFQVAYTWSHAIDNSTADFFSTVISPRRPQDFRNLPAERSNSILDHAHRLTIAAIYDAPWYKGSSSMLKKNVLGNWEIAPIYTYESGQWGTVQSGVDANLNYDAAGDRAIYNPAGVAGRGSDVIGLVATSGPQAGNIVAYQAIDPTARYVVAQQGTVATSSRNTLQTPAINNVDLSVAKHFSITERYKIDFMAQAFNAFNHPQWVTGYVNLVNQFNNGTAGITYFTPGEANFNNAKTTFPSNARTMQLALKFIF